MGSFDDVQAQLYTLAPERFVAARSDAVTRARAAGDRALATRVGALRRPTVAAWLVNLLAHRRPDLVADLLELGRELRAAQRQLHGSRLRQLSQRRRQLVATLARQAQVLAVRAGRAPDDPLPLAAVEATLAAALSDAEVAEDVRLGRLTRAVEYAGFGEPPDRRLHVVRDADATAPDRAEGPDRPGGPDEPERTAEARRLAEEDRVAEEYRIAEEHRLAEQRRQAALTAARRELFSARTALSEAETAFRAAEQSVVAAKRRVEAAAREVEAREIVAGAAGARVRAFPAGRPRRATPESREPDKADDPAAE